MLKKLKTLPVILRLAALVLAIVAFCMMFGANVNYVSDNIITGKSSATLPIFGDSDAGIEAVGGVIVGYILILVGGLVPVATALLLKNKTIDLVAVAAAIIMVVVGAILVFCAASLFKSVNGDGTFTFSGIASGKYELGAGAVVGGILAIVAALANAGSVVLGLKK